MVKLKRVCIPLGDACNFNCKYCYRGIEHNQIPTTLTDEMREYLRQIDSSWCQAVCLTGGEPLLYIDSMREVFDLVKPSVHKRIFTNGSLLTQEIVDYLNEKQVEVVLSHDGAETEYLRGRDILKEQDKVKLIRQLDILSVFCVCTNRNTDIMENYRYTMEKLGREDIFFTPYQVYDNSVCHELIDGFNYDEFSRSFREYRDEIYFPVPYISMDGETKKNLFNVTLDGKVVDKNTLEQFGTINDSFEECQAKRDISYKDKYCRNTKCPIRETCKAPIENASEHYCRCIKIMEGFE